MSQWKSLQAKAFDFKHEMQMISRSPPTGAIRRICNKWYNSYAKEKGLDIGKIEILLALAVQENTIHGFLNRLQELPKFIDNYRCTSANPVIFSTIHSAKGLEFDTVYIIDAYDGCLPTEYIERAMEHGKIDIHEEERRLFYVVMTRAKNKLCLLAVDNEYTTFIDEIVPTDEEDDDEI